MFSLSLIVFPLKLSNIAINSNTSCIYVYINDHKCMITLVVVMYVIILVFLLIALAHVVASSVLFFPTPYFPLT